MFGVQQKLFFASRLGTVTDYQAGRRCEKPLFVPFGLFVQNGGDQQGGGNENGFFLRRVIIRAEAGKGVEPVCLREMVKAEAAGTGNNQAPQRVSPQPVKFFPAGNVLPQSAGQYLFAGFCLIFPPKIIRVFLFFPPWIS